MTERSSAGPIAWLRGRPRAGWILVGLAAVAGAVLGWQIRWIASLPGLEALGAFVLILLVGGVVLLGVIVGGLLLAFHRRTAGQVLLMGAIALAVAAGLGAAVGPTYRSQQVLGGELTLALEAPADVALEGSATCETPANSDVVRHIKAVSIGYALKERTTVTLLLTTNGEAEVTLTRGQEATAGSAELPPYGMVAGSSVRVEAETNNRGGTVVFTGLGPLAAGALWGPSDGAPLLDGEVRWACDRDPLTVSNDPRLSGTIELTGAATGSLPLTGSCLDEGVMADFSVDLSGKVPGQTPPAGDAIGGTIFSLDTGWELTLFRPGTDTSSNISLADQATFTRRTDAAGAVTGERLDADFTFPYGPVHLVAEWRCEPA